MASDLTLVFWTKPSCVQCDAVKRQFVQKVLGFSGTMIEVKEKLAELIADPENHMAEIDLTSEEASKDLQYFKGLGYTSAPITEYGTHLVSGYVPPLIDDLIEAWQVNHRD